MSNTPRGLNTAQEGAKDESDWESWVRWDGWEEGVGPPPPPPPPLVPHHCPSSVSPSDFGFVVPTTPSSTPSSTHNSLNTSPPRNTSFPAVFLPIDALFTPTPSPPLPSTHQPSDWWLLHPPSDAAGHSARKHVQPTAPPSRPSRSTPYATEGADSAMAAPQPQLQNLDALLAKFPDLLKPNERNLPQEQRNIILRKRVQAFVQQQQAQRKGQVDAAILQQQKAQQAQAQAAAAAAAANGGVRPPNAQAGPSQSPRVGMQQPQLNGQQIQMTPQVS